VTGPVNQGAGVFARALQSATFIDPGFDPCGVELAELDLSLANFTPETGRGFLNELTDRVQRVTIAARTAGWPGYRQ
jgi:hypothetical protein